MNRCTSALSGAQAYIHLTPAGGMAIGLALIVVGMLIAWGLAFWIQDQDDRRAEEQVAAEEESLAIATRVVAPYTSTPGAIPAQRVTNGEDLLHGSGSDR